MYEALAVNGAIIGLLVETLRRVWRLERAVFALNGHDRAPPLLTRPR